MESEHKAVVIGVIGGLIVVALATLVFVYINLQATTERVALLAKEDNQAAIELVLVGETQRDQVIIKEAAQDK